MAPTATPPPPVDYRRLMKKVETTVAAIERGGEAEHTIHAVTDQIVSGFRDELGIYGGRLYARDGDQYVLRTTFGEAKEVPSGLKVPRSYRPIEELLDRGVIFMEGDDPASDPELERELGVEQFAGIVVGDEEFILAFNVAPGHEREDILFSLGILRHAINQKIRRERMEDVFRQARHIQASILPRREPRFPPYTIAGRNEPMESVGGDFYDYIALSEKVLGLAIADVSGHGLPAALQVRDIYVGLRMGLSRDLKIVRTVERLNRIIHESTLTSRFVSMFYCELEKNGVAIYVNAGHPPPFHLATDGTVTFLDQGGPVLGPLAESTYDRGFVQMEPGELLVLYTDGITEATRGGAGGVPEEFGVERLVAVAEAHRGRPAAEVVEAVFAALAAWSGGGAAADDRTVVAVSGPAPEPRS